MLFINMLKAFAFSDDILFIFSVGNKVMIVWVSEQCVAGCAVYDIEGCKMLSPLKACHHSPESEPRVRALAPAPGFW